MLLFLNKKCMVSEIIEELSSSQLISMFISTFAYTPYEKLNSA